MKSIAKVITTIIVFLLMGCSAANMVVSPYSNLEIKTGFNVNPDMNGRPSPVVVYVFELTSDTLFTSQDFFSLYENTAQTLGPDLVNKTELYLSPGQNTLYESTMKPSVEYIGIVVAYRDIENANWRKVIKVDRKGYNTYELSLDELSLAIK
ncbi:type VI secretion system lipoprotein TssJ [Vibrio vulnificus]|nr:type VI secretion system lipoprotein TssJ [Vibrio vulnificus]EKA7349029.1 type VI secretion system lipoprotein TssJ [Vibrio vulnificus]MCU8217625.1 type VI secretion system lipoprotein TssJ [Vibrio vulnificus]